MIRFILVILVSALVGCSSQEEADFKRAQKAISQKHYRIAIGYLDKVIKRDASEKYPLEAAREAARISFFEIKDYAKAIHYYHQIVLKSSHERERIESQKQIASIYFNNLQNYQQAVIEYSKLQQMPLTALEQAQYKMNIARAQYYLNNFFEAESEIAALLKLRIDESIVFSALMLNGNILVARKEFQRAANIFRDLLEKYPEKAAQENVALTLAVCYEESGDFNSAILVLEKNRLTYKPPEYIELRIKRLRERMRNAPGAKGYRK